MDLLKVLRVMEDLESRMSALYAKYFEWFQEDPAAEELFVLMSRDEASHRNVIRFEIAMVSKNRGDFGDVQVNLEEIQKLIARVDRVCLLQTIPSLAEAVKLALEFEHEAAEKHYCSDLIRQSNPGLAPVIKAMHKLRSAGHQHRSALEKFAQNRGFVLASPQPQAAL